MRPYPKYKDSGVEWIGDVPEGWGISKLKWFSKIYSGTNIKNELGTYPLYGANGIIGKCITDSFATEKVIIGRVGSSGEINFATGIYGVSDNALVVDNSKDITSKFLFYFLTTINFSTDITLNAQPLLTATNVKNKFIAIPNSKEQQSIINYLDRKTIQIDNLISKKQKLIELLKEERAAIINQAVTKGLNPDAPMKDSGIEWLGEVPEHWEVKRLKFFYRLITKKNYSAETKKIALENIESWTGRLIDSEADYQGEGISFHKGDILFGKLRPYLAKVLCPHFSGASIGDIYVIRPKSGVSSKFTFYRFVSRPFIEVVNGSTFGAKMPRANWSFIANLYIAMPNFDEQRTVSGYLDHITTKIDQTTFKIEKQIEFLKEFRTALISEVVTGKIDVRDGGSNG